MAVPYSSSQYLHRAMVAPVKPAAKKKPRKKPTYRRRDLRAQS